MPNLGDLVDVYPAPEHCTAGDPVSRVLAHPARFMLAVGERLAWTAHLAARHTSGEILIRPPLRSGEPLKAPPDFVPGEINPDDGSPPVIGHSAPTAPKE